MYGTYGERLSCGQCYCGVQGQPPGLVGPQWLCVHSPAGINKRSKWHSYTNTKVVTALFKLSIQVLVACKQNPILSVSKSPKRQTQRPGHLNSPK